MTVDRFTILVLFAFLAAALCTTSAWAHTGPGGARVEQNLNVTLDSGRIAIAYTIELNRQAAFLEVLRMDQNADGSLSREEQDRYFADLREKLLDGLEIVVDGQEATPKQVGQMQLEMPFRKVFHFEVPLPADWHSGTTIELHNDNYLAFPGVVAVELDPGTDADIVYDSRWDMDTIAATTAGDPSGTQVRDVVFRCRAGSGGYEPTAESVVEALDTELDVASAATKRSWGRHVPLMILGLVLAALVVKAVVAVLASRVAVPRVKLAAILAVAVVSAFLLAVPLTAPQGRASDRADVAPLRAGRIFQNLHGRIYQAFAARSESELYDILAEGLDGRLLDDVYNEIYQALMARGSSATRFDVRRVKPIATAVLPAESRDPAAFRVRYRWRVYGTVTHFGHTHARFNEYEAVYTVRHTGRAWRITDSEVRQNKRVSIGLS